MSMRNRAPSQKIVAHDVKRQRMILFIAIGIAVVVVVGIIIAAVVVLNPDFQAKFHAERKP